MPVNLRYSATLDTTYSSNMDDDDDVMMSSTWRSRSRTSLAGSSDSLDLLVSGSGTGTGTPSGSGSGHSRQTSADSGADSRNSASPSAEQKEVVIASSSARGLKSAAKPAHNPLQFVKTGVCPLYKKAAEQMKKAEEVRKVRQMTREQEEEWQSNLDNWKSKRRQIGQKSVDEALDDRQQQMEDRHRRQQQQQQRKSKTFSEMMEERTRRSVASKVVIYHDDDEWSASPQQPQPNGNGNKADNLNDNDSALSPTPRLDTSFDSSLSDHVFNEELKSDMLRSETEQVVPDVTPAEECTFENAIRSYAQYAESRTSRGSSVASLSQRSSSFSSCSNSSNTVPLLGQGDHDESGGQGPSPAQPPRRDIGDQLALLVVLKRGEPRDFGFGTKSGRETLGSVLVESVQTDGPADMAGLRVDDEVLSINGESTSNRSHSAIVFAIKQAVYTGSLELRVHRAKQPGQTATDLHTEQDADPGTRTPRSGSVMKRRSLFERAASPAEDSPRERENLSRSVKSLDVAESLKERLASFESPELRGEKPHSCNDSLEDIRTDSSFQEKLRTFQIMNSTESDERRQISAIGPNPSNKRKTSHQIAREWQSENENKRQFERTQSCGVLHSTACDQRQEVGHGDHTVPCVEFEARMDTGSPSSGGFHLAETLQETAIIGSRPTSPDASRSKFPEDAPSSPANELTFSTAKREPVEAAAVENQNFDLENNCSLNDREVPIMLDEDEYLVPIRMAEPPKEKPPPPPIDSDSTVDPLPAGEKVPMSISQDIWRRRSNFLGTKASELEDFIEREIRHVNSPPDMETLLKAERQQDESSRRERGNSVRSWDGTDLCVASHHEALYENVPLRHHRLENDSNCDDDDIARKEQEIIENLEREERQKGDNGKVIRTTNGNEVSPGHIMPEDRDTWEEALKLRAKEEELRRQEELLRLEKEKLRQEQEILMRQKEAYKQQIEQHRQMMPSASTSLQSETSTRPKSAPPPPPAKPRLNHHTHTPNHRPPCSPPLALASPMTKDLASVTASTSTTPNHYDEPRALTMPISASHSPAQPSWSASSSSSASLSMSSSTASSALSAHSASASPRAKLTDDDRWKAQKPSPEDCNVNLQRHWVVQEAEMRRMAEHNERTKDEDGSYSVPQPLIGKMGQTTNNTRDSEYTYAYGMHAPAIRYTPAVGAQTRPDVSARTVALDQHNHRGHDGKQMVAPLPAPRRPLPSTPVQSAVQSQTITNGNGVGNSHHRDPQMLSVSGKKKCSHCKEELGRGAAMVIESLELFYHIHCFQCCVCHVQLGNGLSGADVRVRNHKLHCHNCYSSDDGLKFSKV